MQFIHFLCQISYILISDGSNECYDALNNGWKKVRHIPANTLWFPGDDNLQGDASLGDPTNDNEMWSLIFTDEVPNFDEFLFTSGDCANWLVASKSEVYKSGYSNEGIATIAWLSLSLMYLQ